MQTSTLVLVGGAIVAGAIGAAIYVRPVSEASVAQQPSPEVEVSEAAATSVTPSETAVTEGAPEARVLAEPSIVADEEPAPEAAPEAAPESAPEPQESSAQVDEPAVVDGPVLTDLRFEPDGGLVLSGTAQPGADVDIMVDGQAVERSSVQADGTFFYVGFLGFSDAARTLAVISDPDGAALVSDRTFVLAANPAPAVIAELDEGPAVEDDVAATEVSEPAEEEAAATEAPEPAEEDVVVAEVEDVVPSQENWEDAIGEAETLVESATVVEAAPATETTVQTEEVAEALPEVAPAPVIETPATPAIIALSEEGVEVIQAPVAADTPPEVMSNVALDTITYDAGGDVVLQGRAVGAGFVQVYVDNARVSRLPIDASGTWRGDLPDVDRGVYTLRIDEVDAEGEVVSRIETPFLREDPQAVADAISEEVADPTFTVATRTVQPGATLWAIAEERYGSGVQYVTVFEANRDRIRDPNLIYPGQVFVLPEDAH